MMIILIHLVCFIIGYLVGMSKGKRQNSIPNSGLKLDDLDYTQLSFHKDKKVRTNSGELVPLEGIGALGITIKASKSSGKLPIYFAPNYESTGKWFISWAEVISESILPDYTNEIIKVGDPEYYFKEIYPKVQAKVEHREAVKALDEIHLQA